MKDIRYLIINPELHNNAYNVWLDRGKDKVHRPINIGPAAILIDEYNGSHLFYSVHGKWIPQEKLNENSYI